MRAILVFLLWSAAPLPAVISVTPASLADRSYHAGPFAFTVEPEDGYVTTATLDGEPIAAGEPHIVTKFGYHELRVEKQPAAGGESESLYVRFIVRDPSRGSSNTYPDAGLDSWTPLSAVDAPADALDTATLQIVAPVRAVAGGALPVRAALVDGEGYPVPLVGTVEVTSAGGRETFRIYRGMGGKTLRAPGDAGEMVLTFRAGSAEVVRRVTVEAAPTWRELAGALTGATEIPEDSFVDVTGDVTLPAGASLTIGAGSLVRLAAGAEFDVRGTLTLAGTADRPIAFVPAGDQPWGGFWVRDATAKCTATHALFTGGGAEDDWIDTNDSDEYPLHSHRDEQPVLTFSATTGAVEDCMILDCPTGQAFHAEDAGLTVRRTLIQRMITGGQINDSELVWDGNVLVEMPVDDAVFSASIASADNDGLYLAGGHSALSRSVFGWCKDDGTDAGSGSRSDVTVTRCWWESCFHEGMAWSEGGPRVVRDTVTINNGQGIECGFSGFGEGQPAVDAQRVFSTANLIGARFGDNYTSSYPGLFGLTDSLILFNGDDVFLREWDSWEYRSDRTTLTGSVAGAAQPEHPDLPVYDPSDPAHLAMLRPFLVAPDAASGFAIAERDRQRPRSAYGGEVRIRLDRPAPAARTVSWRIVTMASAEADGGVEAARGDLTFVPGQSVAALALPVLDGAADLPWVTLLADGSPGCTATGPRVMVWGDSGLPDPPEPPAPAVLVPAGSVWKFHAGPEEDAPPAEWIDPGFDDAAWPSGPARLGTGDDGEVTAVPGDPANPGSGGDARPFAAVFFRHSFEVADPGAPGSLQIRLLRDDGAAVWLNGVPLLRSNLPASGALSYTTEAGSAVSGDDEDTWFPFADIDPSALRAGPNVLAVAVHQANIDPETGRTDSSDLGFDLELAAVAPREPVPPAWRVFAAGGETLATWSLPDAVLESSPDCAEGSWTPRAELVPPVTLRPDGPRHFYRLRSR